MKNHANLAKVFLLLGHDSCNNNSIFSSKSLEQLCKNIPSDIITIGDPTDGFSMSECLATIKNCIDQNSDIPITLIFDGHGDEYLNFYIQKKSGIPFEEIINSIIDITNKLPLNILTTACEAGDLHNIVKTMLLPPNSLIVTLSDQFTPVYINRLRRQKERECRRFIFRVCSFNLKVVKSLLQ